PELRCRTPPPPGGGCAARLLLRVLRPRQLRREDGHRHRPGLGARQRDGLRRCLSSIPTGPGASRLQRRPGRPSGVHPARAGARLIHPGPRFMNRGPDSCCTTHGLRAKLNQYTPPRGGPRMSHFTVTVALPGTLSEDEITEALAAALAPYDENKEVPRYVKHTRAELIEKGREEIAEFRERAYEKYMADPVAYAAECRNLHHLDYVAGGTEAA